MTTTAQGTCICGATRYEADIEAMAFQYCHCSRCRKSTGTVHAANIFVPAANLRWLEGEEQVQEFDLPDAKYWRKAFCKTCGSPTPYVTKTGKAWVIPAGGLVDDPGIKPDKSIFFGSRGPWYEHVTDLPIYDEFPPRTKG